ncbi:MAG: TRAP transporter permease, partial [Thermovirgaceae bacterium]|nr:TRAP transporter permease [Thermovirgaceae bacterium]
MNDYDKIEELIEEVEGKKRKPAGLPGLIIAAIAIAASIFHLYTAALGLLPAMQQRAIHWMFMGSLIFLLYPISKKRSLKKIDPWDWALAGLIVAGCLYILLNWNAICDREGMAITSDIIMGTIMTLLVIEATRRSMGWPLPIVAMMAILYALGGRYMPGMLAHAGFPVSDLAPFFYLRTDGIFGIPLGVSATFIFLFVLFGTVLNISGAGQFFIDIALALTGRSVGGPAKAGVVACALMGTVSGSSVANAVTTGSFTIPLMRRAGYADTTAGGIVAASSTGGQIMPPVMGAAAFIMAQFLGVSYWEIVIAAALPATLYFASIFAMVHFRAGKLGIKGMSREELPHLVQVFKRGWHLLVPIITLVVFLALGYSPSKAVFWSLAVLIVVTWIGAPEYRITPEKLLKSLIVGGTSAIEVAAACACAGIIIGVVGITGLGLTFSSFLLDLSHGILPLTLALTMVASLILGMGLPTTANYVVCSTILAPALMGMNVTAMSAHLFIFYFGILADVTPPVALAAYAASGVAGSNPMKTGFSACIMALGGFLIPYMFVYNGALLCNGSLLNILLGLIPALIGIIGLAAAVQGYFLRSMSLPARLVFGAIPFLLIYPSRVADLLAAG